MAQNTFSLDNLVTKKSQKSLKKQVGVSLTLAKHLLLNYGKDINLVFSPISIQVVLSLIAAGSSGETLDQLLSFLKVKTLDDLSDIYSHLVHLVLADDSTDGGPHLSSANGVWIDQALTFKPSFKEVVDTLYKAACHEVDFQKKVSSSFLILWKACYD